MYIICELAGTDAAQPECSLLHACLLLVTTAQLATPCNNVTFTQHGQSHALKYKLTNTQKQQHPQASKPREPY